MKKIIALGMLAFLFTSCSSSTKDTEKGDLFTELRKLNLVDETSLSPAEKEDHDNHKQGLNQQLTEFLAQPENTTDFPTLESRKKEVSEDLIGLNGQDESRLTPEELTDLRAQRTKDIDELQDLLERGQLFKDIKNLNEVDESSLSPEDKTKHMDRKSELSNQLEAYLGRDNNKSSNPDVQKRVDEILADLKNINARDESTMTPEDLTSLRNQRTNDILELLGLLDGSIVPEEEPPVAPEPQEEPVVPSQEQPVVTPAPTPQQQPAPRQRGELFDEILKLNSADESSMDPNTKSEHTGWKQDLNKELQDTLAKDENKLINPSEEEEKNNLANELIELNSKDEATLGPDELTELRNRRTELVEKLRDLLSNAQRHEAVEYGIVTEESQGIAVTQKPEKAIDVVFTDMLFAFNKTNLRPNVRKTLDRIAEYLKGNPDLRADIGGHSDNIGPEWAKTKVANGRAANAKRYLVSKGVEASRLDATGYSDRNPIAKPFTRVNRRKNRRVEIHITGVAKEEAAESASQNSDGNM